MRISSSVEIMLTDCIRCGIGVFLAGGSARPAPLGLRGKRETGPLMLKVEFQRGRLRSFAQVATRCAIAFRCSDIE